MLYPCHLKVYSCQGDSVRNCYYFITSCFWKVGRDIALTLATTCRLDCQQIESLWCGDCPYPSGPALVHTQPLVQWVLVLPGG